MFNFAEFFSNQDSAERNDLLRREFEVSVGSAQMRLSEMGQLIGKGWLMHSEGIDGLNYV